MSLLNSAKFFSQASLSAYIPGKFTGLLLAANSTQNTYRENIQTLVVYQILSLFACMTISSHLLWQYYFDLQYGLFLAPMLTFASLNLLIIGIKYFLLSSKKRFPLKSFLAPLFDDIPLVLLIRVLITLIIGWSITGLAITSMAFVQPGSLQEFVQTYYSYTPVICLGQFIGSIAFIFPGGLGIFEFVIMNMLRGGIQLSIDNYYIWISNHNAASTFVGFFAKLKL